MAPVIISARANIDIIINDITPITAFSLIELSSLNIDDRNFFIVFGNLLTNKYNKKGRPSPPFF
jgi:hypothetical protein